MVAVMQLKVSEREGLALLICPYFFIFIFVFAAFISH